jgi:MFS family permease
MRISPLSPERVRVLELGGVVLLWQAAVGVYFLSLVQQYLPQALDTGAAYPGYAMACYGVAKFLWQTPAGWIADRIGRRVTMVAGIAGSIPVLTLMMTIPDATVFLGLSALLGAGAATMWPAFMAHVGETTPHVRRARTMSVLNIAQMIGIGLGTLAGVLMVDFVTYGAAFWACIAFNMLALLVVVRRIDTPSVGRAPAESQPVRTVAEGAWRPGIAMLAVIVLFLTLGTSLHTPMIGAYTNDVLDVKMSYMALFFPLPALAAGIALWRFGHLTDRLPRQVPLVAGMLVAAMCIFLLTQTRDPFIVANLVVLAGLAYAVSIPAWGAAALDATDVGSRGLWLGALSAVQGLGVAGGQALGGVIGGVWGPLAPFKLAALLLMVALTLTVANQYAHARQRRNTAAIPVRID